MFGIFGKKFWKRNSVFVKCCWDPDANVWYVAESSMDGLAVDAESIDLLLQKLQPMIRDLVDEANSGHNSDDKTHSVPFELLINGTSGNRLGHC